MKRDRRAYLPDLNDGLIGAGLGLAVGGALAVSPAVGLWEMLVVVGLFLAMLGLVRAR